MIYRKLPHGEEKISIIGLGMGSMHESSDKEIEMTIRMAIEKGINFFDLIATDEKPFKPYGNVFRDNRDKIYVQMHLGASYKSGKYGWTRDLEEAKEDFFNRMKLLNLTYADFGFLHCVDEKDDFDVIMSEGLFEYAKELKKEGVIRHLGFSSHSPEIAKRFIDTGLIDLFMFSINPVYDYAKGEFGLGSVKERSDLYEFCEKSGIAISVMKPFCGGQLFIKENSPFRETLSISQCLQYALDRPGVLTALPGVKNRDELKQVMHYFDASEAEKDYSVISSFAPQETVGKCVYCNHCQPCPVGLDIGMINKYYDLAKIGDEIAADHYNKLPLHASDCIQCGHCERRCPFMVKQESRMKAIKNYFGS